MYDKTYNLSSPEFDEENNISVQKLIVTDMTSEELEIAFSSKWKQIRTQRNDLLRQSDLMSLIYLPDVWPNKSEEYQQSWLSYRQQLRDITLTYVNPFQVVWPAIPAL